MYDLFPHELSGRFGIWSQLGFSQVMVQSRASGLTMGLVILETTRATAGALGGNQDDSGWDQCRFLK